MSYLSGRTQQLLKPAGFPAARIYRAVGVRVAVFRTWLYSDVLGWYREINSLLLRVNIPTDTFPKDL